ncbi:50S ribosomal protein L33 [Planococcus versutus]|uniref:Large ribosomal subunit protein bL33 n=1 Tax=Planococcus versutus TaxID=1302659 RepID=A0A1B1S1T8_9BACL|nr:50S ribosomal protein L33 [Planococcus versutus]
MRVNIKSASTEASEPKYSTTKNKRTNPEKSELKNTVYILKKSRFMGKQNNVWEVI